jgi:DUF1009 family protein
VDQLPAIGLLAGAGKYPLVVARSLRRQGHRVICAGVKDHADPRLRAECDAFRELGLGKLGTAVCYFHRHGATQATMAGKIHKVILFQRFFWLKHLPDWQGIRTFFPHFVTKTADRKDDTMLTAVVEAFARKGITFAPATEYLPELLVKQGVLSRRRPSSAERKDIEFGWEIAKELGRLDVGQSVAVKDRAVMALEAIEGTDKCIRRAGQLCSVGGFTLVKVAKPNQDMRFDVPTIGTGTLEALLEAGGQVLAVEADRTILIDEPEVLEFANRHRLTVVAIRHTDANHLACEAA